jgi:hypothetical protein
MRSDRELELLEREIRDEEDLFAGTQMTKEERRELDKCASNHHHHHRIDHNIIHEFKSR